MIKRMLFWFIVGCALWFGFSSPDRLAVETDRSIHLWGYELRFQLLLEADEVAPPAAAILPTDTLAIEIITACEESQ